MEEQGQDVVTQAKELISHGEHQEAIELLEPWLQENPEDVSGWAALGAAHFELENWTEAEKAARQVVRVRPDSAREWCNLGTVLRKLGELPEAERAQYRALSVDPGHKRARLELVKLHDLGSTPEPKAHPAEPSPEAGATAGGRQSRRQPSAKEAMPARTGRTKWAWKDTLKWTVVPIALVVFLWIVFVPKGGSVNSEQQPSAQAQSSTELVSCPQCGGRGEIRGPEQRRKVVCGYCSGLRKATCNLCNGTGWVRNPAGLNVRCYKCGGDGLRDCPVCGGTGTRWETNTTWVRCAYCGGKGKVTRYQREYWEDHYGRAKSASGQGRKPSPAGLNAGTGSRAAEQHRQAQARLDEQETAREAAARTREAIAKETEHLFRRLVLGKISCLAPFFDPSTATLENRRSSGLLLAGIAAEAHHQAVGGVASNRRLEAAEVERIWTKAYRRPSGGSYAQTMTPAQLGVRTSSVDFIEIPNSFLQSSLAGYYGALGRGAERHCRRFKQDIISGYGEKMGARAVFERLGWE